MHCLPAFKPTPLCLGPFTLQETNVVYLGNRKIILKRIMFGGCVSSLEGNFSAISWGRHWIGNKTPLVKVISQRLALVQDEQSWATKVGIEHGPTSFEDEGDMMITYDYIIIYPKSRKCDGCNMLKSSMWKQKKGAVKHGGSFGPWIHSQNIVYSYT